MNAKLLLGLLLVSACFRASALDSAVASDVEDDAEVDAELDADADTEELVDADELVDAEMEVGDPGGDLSTRQHNDIYKGQRTFDSRTGWNSPEQAKDFNGNYYSDADRRAQLPSDYDEIKELRAQIDKERREKAEADKRAAAAAAAAQAQQNAARAAAQTPAAIAAAQAQAAAAKAQADAAAKAQAEANERARKQRELEASPQYKAAQEAARQKQQMDALSRRAIAEAQAKGVYSGAPKPVQTPPKETLGTQRDFSMKGARGCGKNNMGQCVAQAFCTRMKGDQMDSQGAACNGKLICCLMNSASKQAFADAKTAAKDRGTAKAAEAVRKQREAVARKALEDARKPRAQAKGGGGSCKSSGAQCFAPAFCTKMNGKTYGQGDCPNKLVCCHGADVKRAKANTAQKNAAKATPCTMAAPKASGFGALKQKLFGAGTKTGTCTPKSKAGAGCAAVTSCAAGMLCC